VNAIDVFDARLEPKGRIEPNHQSSLVVEGRKFPVEFSLNGEIARNLFVLKMAVVTDKSVVSFPPEIGSRIRSDHKRLAFLLPDFGFVEPHHEKL
jgi:hypothetical protein